MQDINTIDPQWFAVIVSIISLAITFSLALKVFRLTQETQPTYQCDTQFFEIQKLLLSDADLHDFYKLDPVMANLWSTFTPADKKMYIFCETYYFHLAFVYREYKEKRIPENYWNIVNNFIIKLKKYSPMFMQVHSNERLAFEKEFGEPA
jgi:hypothetical protein